MQLVFPQQPWISDALSSGTLHSPIRVLKHPYSTASHLLLIPEDSVVSFFENANVENNITSFISFTPSDAYGDYTSAGYTPDGYSLSARTYAFGNISRLLKEHIENNPDNDLSLLVIPVTRKTGSYTSNRTTYYYTTGISHSFYLSGIKLRTEEEYMKVVVLSSQYDNE